MLASTALILLIGLIPAQAGKLEISNVRATLGALGPARPDMRILPGDALPVAFDITGLQADKAGAIRFTTLLEVLDGDGKSLFKQDLGETLRFAALAGSRVRHAVLVSTGLEQPPGSYRLKVLVTDAASKQTANMERPFVVTPPEFGLVRVQLSHDLLAQMPAPGVGAAGQLLYLNLVVVGFKPDPKNNGLGTVNVELQILEEEEKGGRQPKPLVTATFRNIPADTLHFPVRFELPLQKAGAFRAMVKATDQASKKVSIVTIPLTVLDLK